MNSTEAGPGNVADARSGAFAISAWVPLSGGGTGYVRREWQGRLAAAVLTRAEDFFDLIGEPLMKPGLGRRYRARLTIGDGAETTVVYLKRYGGETWRDLVRRWFEDGRRAPVAEREVRVSEVLARLGVPSVTPFAWGWLGGWGPRQQSFVMSAEVPGVSLERWLLDRVRPPERRHWRQKCSVIEELALLVRRLHGAGWRHRDLYLCHVFIDERAPGFTLTLLDLARVFQPRMRLNRWRVKDLAQLHYSAGTHISRALRMRFLHHYLGCRKLSASQRRFLRRIQIKRNTIAIHDSH